MRRTASHRWQVHQGENLPEMTIFPSSTYAIRLNDLNNQIVISPLPFGYIPKKLEEFQYLQDGHAQKIYDKETGRALKPFIIECYVDLQELKVEDRAVRNQECLVQ